MHKLANFILALMTAAAIGDAAHADGQQALYSAVVSANGHFLNSIGGVRAKQISTGFYAVDFDRDVSNCAASATLRGKNGGQISALPSAVNTSRVQVSTFASNSSPADNAFMLQVMCPVELVINEVMADPQAVSDTVGEWIELANISNHAVNILGMRVSTDTQTITLNCNVSVPANGFVVLGNSGDTAANGGVPVDCVYGGLSLVNSGFKLSISDGDSVDFHGLAFTTGKARNLSSLATDPVSNDNLGHWCDASSQYGVGDFGTPDQVNASCP